MRGERTQRVLHDAALTLASQVGGVAVAFAASVAVARRLGPAGAGVVQLAQTLGNQVALVLSLGAAISVVRFTAVEDGRRPFGAGLVLALGLLPVVAALTAVAPLIAKPLLDDSGRQGLAITLAVPLGWVFIVQDMTLAAFRGANRYRQVAALSLGARVVVSAALVAALFVEDTATAAVAAVLIANAAAAAVIAALGWRAFPPAFERAGETVRRLVAYNLRGHVGTILQEASYRLDLFLVAALRSTAEAGVYGVAGILVTLLWYVPNAIGTVLMSRLPTSADPRRLVDAAGATLALMLGLAGLAAVTAPVVVPAVFGPRFDGAVAPFLILLPGAVLLSVWKVVANGLAGLGHPAAKVPSAAVGAVLSLGLDLWLIPEHGIKGAAAAATIAYSVTALWLLPAAARIVGARPVDFLRPSFSPAYWRS